jgi:hypothetical protein
MFPELQPLFAARFEDAAVGESLVLPMLDGKTDAAFRDPIHRAIERAGLTVWCRLWQSLRATRQTELEDRFPTHVVCNWMGNQPATAQMHYLKTTDEHFAAATGQTLGEPEIARCSGLNNSAASAANALHGQRQNDTATTDSAK